MNYAWKVDVSEGESGKFAVQRFTVSEHESGWSFISGKGQRGVPRGEYTRLVAKNSTLLGGLIMSDTPDERRDHIAAIIHARNHVLLNGLGLGCVLQACLEKSEVEKVTVIEISSDVIALVGNHYQKRYGDRVEIIQADAFEYKPPPKIRYGAVWHDIWASMCEDHLPEMHKLHRKYGRRADWQGSWGRERIEKEKRRTVNAFWRR